MLSVVSLAISFFPTALKFIFSPAGAMVAIALSYGVGDLRGRYLEHEKCEARIAASIVHAKAVDGAALAEAQAASARETQAEAGRMNAAEKRIRDYADAIKKKSPKAACALSDSDVDFLASGVSR